MSFASGSIVKAREREWVVLPGSSEKVFHLRPLGGNAVEQTAILTGLEDVQEASFAEPGAKDVGDYRSAQLLRDSAVLGSRNSASAIRCFSRINVQPRSYQLVPLLMALKSIEEGVRLLIADGVGVGKTIEALLIARELWDRGEIDKIAVLCPPALAEQWHREMMDKFQFDSVLVLSSTAPKLERNIIGGGSLFETYPVTVVSLDYIKSERRREEFLRTAPKCVIVDEAHTCVSGSGKGSSHLRYEVVRHLAEDSERHIIFTTATPHSGKQDAFDTLIGMLNPRLQAEQAEVSKETLRSRLARHFVQRRREDITHFIDEDTRFPNREELESTYKLGGEYRKLFDASIAYAQKSVGETAEGTRDHRVRWWSALALLRALGSSPAAAVATLRNRAAATESESAEDADEIGRRLIMDQESGDDAEVIDTVAGSDHLQDEADESSHKQRRKLLELARQAEKLSAKGDNKLQGALELGQRLIDEQFNPIIFCRYIATANYVGEEMRKRLKGVQVEVITGELPPGERETRINSLDSSRPRVLVATDCLSEGINLQEFFDAVVHYDLSWNPTRHEQREGRVDRYGQRKENVRSITLYGTDNPVDGLVLDVLINKHKAIRSELGISIPVPVDTNDVLDALLEGLILRNEWTNRGETQLLLEGFEDELNPAKNSLHGQWDQAKEREQKRLHSRYAQSGIDTAEIAGQLKDLRRSAGGRENVRRLIDNAVQLHGGRIKTHDEDLIEARIDTLPRQLQFILSPEGNTEPAFSFNGARPGCIELFRSHRRVQELATSLIDSALEGTGKAKRAGIIRSSRVQRRTTLLLMRARFTLVQRTAGGKKKEELVDTTFLRGFYRGDEGSLSWIDEEAALKFFDLLPEENVLPDLAAKSVEQLVGLYRENYGYVEQIVWKEAKRIEDNHRNIREAVGRSGKTVELIPQFPVDLLGLYAVLPGAKGVGS